MFKRELIKNKDDGGRMFLTLSALWYKWARKNHPNFTHIKDSKKFGRALMVMMVKDNIVFSKDTWKKSGKISQLKEVDFTEDSPTKAHPQGGRILTNKTTVMDMLDVISHKEFGPDYHKLNNSQKKKVHKIALKHKILESYLEERSKGRLRPADKLRRKRAMAGKKAAIQRKKKRTQKRKKPLDKLKKIAYKMAYLQVYKEFMEDLFPGMKKNELSIAQAKVVHKNVLRKKGRVMKRAKFRFLPALRDKEAQKFGTKESMDMLDQAFLKAKPIDKEIDETAKRDYKDEYKKFQSSKKSKKYRAELNKYNRDKGTYGNGDGKDASHKGGKIVGFESASKNRGRKEKSRLKKESITLDEIGIFPVNNYLKGMIPRNMMDTTTRQKKERLKSTINDLKSTLNHFWKSHDIPYRIK